ncbi:lysyl oxidase-like 2 isoform X1 [Oratosquilla oratoria]|uniref:lysyl oxidase-like 2 isoform X1 n=1 Tax=Oratosquilla oratoria TaxID=337810 RepID=UPI003F768283
MSPHKLLLLLLALFVVLTLLIDDADAARRRRRRRRRRFRGRGVAATAAATGREEGRTGGPPRLPSDGGARRGTRRLRHAGGKRAELIRKRLRQMRERRKGKMFGRVRLVDGRAEWEGNVEIFREGKWGNICDDEWDNRDGKVVCKQLGYQDVEKVTYNSHYGHVRSKYWMDNVYCYGEEKNLTECRHDGWGVHDCKLDEAAGVICQTGFSTTTVKPTLPPRDQPVITNKIVLAHVLDGHLKIRLQGGRTKDEGRIEIKIPGSEEWNLICGDGWGMLEAMVICRQLGLGYAMTATTADFFGGNVSAMALSGVKCNGNEPRLDKCLHDAIGDVFCPGPDRNIAGVSCIKKMADLAPDIYELSRSVHLEDKQLFFLQCAMEENCLASSAYALQTSGYGWHLETRRLLRFTARIMNTGTDAFRPFLPKQYWVWHHCHMHYHSMEVFAHYDIIDKEGHRVAEGHKASFCLEDNNCIDGVEPFFKCANFGDQGISVGCSDTYAYNIDCQWIDITDLPVGTYTFKLSINPQFKVGEITYDNNAAICELIYSDQSAWLGNCLLGRP